MSKEELQDCLDRGFEFQWEYEGKAYYLCPTFHGEIYISISGKVTYFKNVEEAIKAGFDVEKMTKNNSTLSY